MLKVISKKGLLFTLMALLIILSGSNLIGQQKANAAVSTLFSNSGGVITLSNTLLELKWETAHGTLTGLKNKTTGTQFLGGAVAANWSAFINLTTSNKWQADIGTLYKGRDAALSSVTTNVLSNGITVNLIYNGIGGLNVNIVQHITVYDNDPVSRWTTDVTNNQANTTVTNVVTPQLTGLQTLTGESLMWPWKEGEIYANPGNARRKMQYPVPASMQWLGLYNNSESLYYGVLDTTAAFKEFRFGYDPDLDPSGTSPRQMSVTVYPFAGTGTAYTSPTVEIGVGNEGGWYWGADRYRNWLINTAQWQKGKPQKAMELDSWAVGTVKQYGQPISMNYSALPGYIQNMNSAGVNNLEVVGYHTDGFDSFYPDYGILAGAGGDTGLQNAITSIHNNGDTATFYINNHIADTGSNWYLANPGTANLKSVSGGYYPESYPSGRSFLAMSPHSSTWINQLVSRMMDLRNKGADGIWWDQMGEMDAVLDYNSTPVASSPATSFSEGYKTMMDTAHSNFSYNGTQTNYIFLMEGVNDYYSKFVDVDGMMWGRHLGYAAQQAPQVTRYTIPAKFLGLSTAGKADGSLDQYAWAFTMAEPLLLDSATPNPLVFPRYMNIYHTEPTIYFYGTYKDERGLTLSNGNIKGTSIVGQNNDKLGIQLRNLTASPQTVTVTLAYDKIGLAGQTVSSVKNIEGAGNISFSNGTNQVSFTVTVPASDIGAYGVYFGGAPTPTPSPTPAPGCTVQGAILTKYNALGGASGFLGTCITSELTTSDGVGKYNDFQGGSIYWSPNSGAWSIKGAIRDKWVALGKQTSVGYPTTDELTASDGIGRYNDFQGGSIYWSSNSGAWSVMGAIKDKWVALGQVNSYLHYPKTDEYSWNGGRVSEFQGGYIFWSNGVATDHAGPRP